jgi:predicted TIM-barrel fold metal-dependent hydrolase
MIPLIPLIEKLFEEHPNLLADTSALDLPALKLLLSKVDSSRLIFGSDALYFPVWKAWVTFLQALRLVSPAPTTT